MTVSERDADGARPGRRGHRPRERPGQGLAALLYLALVNSVVGLLLLGSCAAWRRRGVVQRLPSGAARDDRRRPPPLR